MVFKKLLINVYVYVNYIVDIICLIKIIVMFYSYVFICVMILFLNCSIVFYGEKYKKKIEKNGKDIMKLF